jgi:parvulin-like peptidyl-prolyl isomerase
LLLAAVVLAGCGTTTTIGVPTPEGGYGNLAPTTAPADAGAEAEVEIVALVNGVPIARETFERELARFEAGQAALGFEVTEQAGYKQQVLDLLVEQELIRQMAAAQGIVVTETEVDAVIQEMRDESGEEYFNGWLVGNMYTQDEFREVIYLDLIAKQLVQPVIDSVPQVVEHVHARHILLNSQAEAEEMLSRLLAGEDFSALAAEFSNDVTTRDIGGDLGWFPRGGLLVPEVEESAFSMTEGQISPVVASAWGYHIVQTLGFETREVEYEMHQRLLERALDDWRVQLRVGADIQQLVTFTS